MKDHHIDKQLIRPIPYWFRWIPFLGTSLAMAIGARAYFPTALYTDLMSAEPAHESVSVYIHEHTHVARQLEVGALRWSVLYLISRNFRLDEELLAIKKEMQYRHAHGLLYNIARKAKHFSSSTYLWMLPYDASVAILRKQWQEVVSSHPHHGS